jgi:hypothetical protein
MPGLEPASRERGGLKRRADGTSPAHEHRAVCAKTAKALDRLDLVAYEGRHQDWLVVTALVLPDLELVMLPEPELVLLVLRDVEPVDPEELFEPIEPIVIDLVVVFTLLASAGSWPETSWTKITPHANTNVAIAAATTRLRIRAARARRVCSRSAAKRLAAARSEGVGAAMGASLSERRETAVWSQ